jgi:hypothetical protein
MQLCVAHSTAVELDQRKPFEFPPTPRPVSRFQAFKVANGVPDCDDFDVVDLTDDLERFHARPTQNERQE